MKILITSNEIHFLPKLHNFISNKKFRQRTMIEDPVVNMTKYCLSHNIRFELVFIPTNYLYVGSSAEKEFKIILMGGSKGKMSVVVHSTTEIEDAISFYYKK